MDCAAAAAWAHKERLAQLRRDCWVVNAKPPFGAPEHVLAYLGRYTSRR
ncbi:transposase [Bradyrhizobium sp. cir1]